MKEPQKLLLGSNIPKIEDYNQLHFKIDHIVCGPPLVWVTHLPSGIAVEVLSIDNEWWEQYERDLKLRALLTGLPAPTDKEIYLEIKELSQDRCELYYGILLAD